MARTMREAYEADDAAFCVACGATLWQALPFGDGVAVAWDGDEPVCDACACPWPLTHQQRGWYDLDGDT